MAEQVACGHCGAASRESDGVWKHVRLGIPDVVPCDWFDETHERTVANPEGPLTVEAVRFYGSSDDLIEVEGCEGADEFNSYERGPVMWRGELVGGNPAETMRVYAIYDGVWSFAIGPVDSSLSLPGWPVRITDHPEVSYSVLLEIDAPAGTRLVNVWPEANRG